MTSVAISLVALILNVGGVLYLLSRYYEARLDQARGEADYWRHEAERHRGPAE